MKKLSLSNQFFYKTGECQILFLTEGMISDERGVQKGKGISENHIIADKGREGVQTPENNTDVICTLPPRVWSQSKTHLVGNRY